MVIFLNGSINSGKSTVAKILLKKINNTAHIEVDRLREFIDWMPLEDAIPINLENTASLIKNFVKRNLNVIVTYPLSEKNYKYLMKHLEGIKVFVFTFNPNLEKTITNRGTRELDNWERERIKYHYNIGINNPSFGTIIDNSNQSPEQTVNQILELIK